MEREGHVPSCWDRAKKAAKTRRSLLAMCYQWVLGTIYCWYFWYKILLEYKYVALQQVTGARNEGRNRWLWTVLLMLCLNWEPFSFRVTHACLLKRVWENSLSSVIHFIVFHEDRQYSWFIIYWYDFALTHVTPEPRSQKQKCLNSHPLGITFSRGTSPCGNNPVILLYLTVLQPP